MGFLRKLVRRTGYDVIQYKASSSRDRRLGLVLQHRKIDLILDVGANLGQFAQQVRALGYTGRIVSFEPQREAHAQLVAAAKSQPNWQIAERCAIGAAPGSLTLNLAGNSVSSSLLPMSSAHLQAAPESAYTGTEQVPVYPLTHFAALLEGAQHILLKSDTQGYEHHVLQGAEPLLPRIEGLLLELLPGPLYEGQPDFFDMMNQVQQWGYACWGFSPDLTDEHTGRRLAVDALFFRG
jgi:FkbM family methyltransferase